MKTGIIYRAISPTGKSYIRQTTYGLKRRKAKIDYTDSRDKLEYWKLDCYEEQVKFLNGPQG